jgi:hypothetical protein
MLTPASKAAVSQLGNGTYVMFKTLDFAFAVPRLVSQDAQALRAAGLECDGEGGHAAAEVFLLNTRLTPDSLRILNASPLTYKLVRYFSKP